MAEISSYPQASPKGSDRVLGIQTYVEGDDSTIGNPTKTFTINDINNLVEQNSGSSVYTTKVVELTPTQMLSLNGDGILELIPAPGAGKIIVVSDILFFLDYGGVAFNITGSGYVRFAYGSSAGNVLTNYTSILNKTADYYLTSNQSLEPEANQALNFKSDSISVTQGNSTVKFSIVYRILNSTTLL